MCGRPKQKHNERKLSLSWMKWYGQGIDWRTYMKGKSFWKLQLYCEAGVELREFKVGEWPTKVFQLWLQCLTVVCRKKKLEESRRKSWEGHLVSYGDSEQDCDGVGALCGGGLTRSVRTWWLQITDLHEGWVSRIKTSKLSLVIQIIKPVRLK